MATDAVVPQMSPLGQAALDYAARGIPVFPLIPRQKRPLTENGFYDATTDADQIRRWWRKWPRANIGMPTGGLSGLILLDIDPAHGGTLDGAIARGGAIPETLMARSGSGGWHVFFRHPGGIVRGHKVLRGGDADEDVNAYEVKADGGYVVLAPSVHPSGGIYAWSHETPAAEIPGWLSRALAEAEEPEERPRGERRTGPISARAEDAAHWLEWAFESKQQAEGTDKGGFLLAQQLLVNEIASPEEILLTYAEQATRNPHDPFTTRDIQRWLKSAEKSALVRGGEKARTKDAHTMSRRSTRSASAPKPTGKPNLRLVDQRGDDVADDAEEEQRESGEEPPTEERAKTHERRTDTGNARRLVRRHGHNLRYVATWGEWLIWDGRRWKRDETGEIYRRAKETAQSIFAEASETEDQEEQKAIVKWAFASESRRGLEAMVKLAQSEPEVAATAGQFDSHPWLLNVRNGTLDLHAGELRAHRREDLLTLLAPVEHDPTARLDIWERFLDTAMGGDAGMVAFLQRAAGYTLTGNTGEEKLFFVHGPTRTGKSSFVEAIKATLGEYAKTADFETWVTRQGNGGPRDDIADLVGARMVASIEINEGKKLAEGLVKTLTGGDTVKARHLYQRGFEFRPAFKLWLVANHEPKVDSSDEAMWSRILRIKFDRAPEKRDPRVKETLRDPRRAGPAILAWMVRGCLAWQREGLAVPQTVEEATEEYRQTMDPLRDFITDCCELEQEAWTSFAVLRETYENWCKANGERWPVSGKKFTELLTRRGCEPKMRRGVAGKPTRGWLGIRVVADV